jgi:hypothetical protein
MVQAYYNVRHEAVEINSTAESCQLHDSDAAGDEPDIFRLKFQNMQMLEAVSKSCYSELIRTGSSELEQDSIVLYLPVFKAWTKVEVCN